MRGALFVTGGTGYIGRHVLRALDSREYEKIVCLSRAQPEPYPAGVEFVRADLLETSVYAAALSGCETVLHMAAVTGKNKPEEYFRVNREGTRSLIGECRRAGVKRIIYVSTIAAKFLDQSRYYYAQSKRQAEDLIVSSGLRFTVVRPTIVIGKAAPVLEGLSRLAAAPVLPIFGNGRALVQPVSVNDLTASLIEILRGGSFESRTVEIGGPERLSMEELMVKIRRARGKPAGPVVHLPAGLIAGALGAVEKVLLPVLPFTAGQIASFVNDGTAAPDPCVAEWQKRMETLDQVLSSVYPA